MSGSERFLCVWWIDDPECVVVHVKQVKTYSRQTAMSLSQERLQKINGRIFPAVAQEGTVLDPCE